MVFGLRGTQRRNGSDRGLLDCALSVARGCGATGLLGQRKACQECAGPQERRARLPMAAVPAQRGLAHGFISARSGHLRSSLDLPLPARVALAGRPACAAYAGSAGSDEYQGLTGQNIVQAILSGQRDPVQLAKLRDKRIQAAESTIAKALEGDWRKEHLFVLQKAWENWTGVQKQIQDCDKELSDYTRELEACTTVIKPVKVVRLKAELLGAEPVSNPAPKKKAGRKTSKNQPEGPWQQELERFFGVDLTVIPGISVLTGLTLMTELGNDLRAFKTEHHFASWLCLCPDNETSASKVLRRRTRRSQNRLRQALRMAASSLHHEKSYLGDKYRRLRARLGAPKAITAMAHQLARIIWTLITRQIPFDQSLFAYHEKVNEQRRLKRLQASARQMGYQLTPIAA